MKIIYTVGIPASGKSQFVEELAKTERAVIVSTDSIREELFGNAGIQKQSSLVYRTMYERVNRYLAAGENVIIDATNIDRGKRQRSLSKVPAGVQKICYYFDTPFDVCLSRNQKRKRTVEERIMKKQHRDLEVPFKGEGFDEVHIVHDPSAYGITKNEFSSLVSSETDYDTLFHTLRSIPLFREIHRFDQENKYHQFLLCEHTYMVYAYVNEYYEGEDKLVLQIAALFHDVGKPFCKVYKPLRETYSYFRHENVSCQLASHFLTELGFEDSFIHDVLAIIQYHMLINYDEERGPSTIYHTVGPDLLTKLYFFREGDRLAK